MNIEIHEADLADPAHRAGIIDVLDSYAADPFGGGKPLPADVRRRLIPGLRQQPTALVLLAFDGPRPVGLAVCFFGFSTFKARPLLNIHDLAVAPGYRGKGVGRALLNAVEARARAKGCCKLTLEVLDDNDRARGLYKSFGFGDPIVGEPASMKFLSKSLGES